MADLLESADKSFEQTTRESDFLYASCFFSLSFYLSLIGVPSFSSFVLFYSGCVLYFFRCIFLLFLNAIRSMVHLFVSWYCDVWVYGAFEYESGQDRFLDSVSLHKWTFFPIYSIHSRMRSSARGSLIAFARCACVVIVIKIYDCFPLLLLFHTFSL